MKVKWFILVSLFPLLGACQHLRPESAPEEEDQPPSATELEQIQVDKVLAEVRRTIRNEILPEMREISLHSKKQRRKSLKLKGQNVEKLIVGRVEWIMIESPKILFKARVDTGAQTNSLHAQEITEKRLEGKNYVEFVTKDFRGDEHRVLAKIIKKSKVKNTSGDTESRYVVRLPLKFGQRVFESNVNLNDRSRLKHKFLIGRNLLIGDYIVDVSQSRLLGGKK